MTKNNIYLPKENIPKTEEVREIDNKYEIPTYEEFIKTYKHDSNLNYDDLNETQKGYGLCPDGCGKMSETVIQDRNGRVVCTLYGSVRFFLEVDCLN
jgi:hypothetical protein